MYLAALLSQDDSMGQGNCGGQPRSTYVIVQMLARPCSVCALLQQSFELVSWSAVVGASQLSLIIKASPWEQCPRCTQLRMLPPVLSSHGPVRTRSDGAPLNQSPDAQRPLLQVDQAERPWEAPLCAGHGAASDHSGHIVGALCYASTGGAWLGLAWAALAA